MATTSSTSVAPSAVVQRLEQLKQRVNTAATRATRVQVQLETARQQHAEAIKEAQRDYQTSDLDELRTKLVSAETENTRAVNDFELAVEEFEKFVTRIEAALADPEKMAELVETISAQRAPVAAPAPAPALAMADAAEDI